VHQTSCPRCQTNRSRNRLKIDFLHFSSFTSNSILATSRLHEQPISSNLLHISAVIDHPCEIVFSDSRPLPNSLTACSSICLTVIPSLFLSSSSLSSLNGLVMNRPWPQRTERSCSNRIGGSASRRTRYACPLSVECFPHCTRGPSGNVSFLNSSLYLLPGFRVNSEPTMCCSDPVNPSTGTASRDSLQQ
jgi:hypothetical protein